MDSIIEKLRDGENLVVLGELPSHIVDYFNLKLTDSRIVMWRDRLEYLEKHRFEFIDDKDFYDNIIGIPNIVNCPDFIGINPNGSGIEFVKKVNSNTMVAIRVSKTGNLAFRSMYPITEIKLANRLNSGRWIPIVNLYGRKP